MKILLEACGEKIPEYERSDVYIFIERLYKIREMRDIPEKIKQKIKDKKLRLMRIIGKYKDLGERVGFSFDYFFFGLNMISIYPEKMDIQDRYLLIEDEKRVYEFEIED